MLLALACMLAAGRSASARSDTYARRILSKRTEEDKGEAASARRPNSIDALAAMMIIKQDPFASIASLVTGMYLEQGQFEGRGTVTVVKALAARESLRDKAATMAAWSPHMQRIVEELIGSSAPADHQFAATILAIYARALAIQRENPASLAGNQDAAARNLLVLQEVDLEPFLTKLLAERNAAIAELAVLAAAYAQVDTLADTIAKLPTGKVPAVDGARLFYLARIKRELPEDLAQAALQARVRPEPRYAELSPLLANCDISGNAVVYACQAVGQAADARFLALLHELLDHKDLRVQMEAARAIERIGSAESVPALLKRLQAVPPWPVKVDLISALGAIPAVESVEPLLKLFEAEKGRMRQNLVYALSSIAGAWHGKTPRDWRQWWDDNRDVFKVDPKATKDYRQKQRVQDVQVEALAEFYEGQIVSDRVVFVLDVSGSMRGKKIENLKTTMENTLQGLPAYAKFNVVTFASSLQVMKAGSLIPAGQKGKAMMLIYDLATVGATRSFDAMEAATQLRETDTLVYLSDGQPTAGQFQAWGPIIWTLDLLQRYRPLAIHCVFLTDAAAAAAGLQGQPTGMKAVADRNCGHLTQPKP